MSLFGANRQRKGNYKNVFRGQLQLCYYNEIAVHIVPNKKHNHREFAVEKNQAQKVNDNILQ